MFRAQVDNTLFLTLQLSNLLLLLSFSIRKHTSMASRTILSNFFEEKRTQNNPQYFSGLSRALSPTTQACRQSFSKHRKKNNGFPFLDILGYLKNTHKNPKFERVGQVPIRELGWEFPSWELSHFVNGSQY